MNIQAPKGTKDLLPQDSYKWHFIENKIKEIASKYCLREIRTPMFEYTELFERGVGETTDVVQKEMYTFNDKGNRSITLKPEGTASAVRAFIENGLFNDAQPTKLYYFTPVFRYENVQKGRLRQHHQFGVEVFGAKAASIDAEIISIAMRVFDELGVEGLKLNINSIGCPECRKKYNEVLKEFLKGHYDELCETCKTRYEKNPMRILDCKETSCKNIMKDAPLIIDFLCEECSEHFENLKTYLNAMNIGFEINPYIVRGLDYYSKTVFEIIDKNITVCGGGRYDYLIEECGGPAMPAVGFGMGIERLLLTLESNNIQIPKDEYIQLYVGSIGEESSLEVLKLVNNLRKKGIKCECDHMAKSVKAQMKYANKLNVLYSMILGEDEITNRIAKIKRMSDGALFDINIDNLDEIVNKVLNS
jgi:histidyl-tRNA synthetase